MTMMMMVVMMTIAFQLTMCVARTHMGKPNACTGKKKIPLRKR